MAEQDPNLEDGFIPHGASSLDLKDPFPCILNYHKDGIVVKISGPPSNIQIRRGRRGKDPCLLVSFAELQRMHIRKLQCKLIDHAISMRFKETEPPTWEGDLAKYIMALKDYDYMELCSQKSRDPFLATAERWVDDEILRQASESVNINNEDLVDQAATEPWEKVRTAIGGTRGVTFRKTWIHKFIGKLIISAIGGAFLVGPMWLMVLHNTRDVCLVSTTIFVAVFGLIMAGSLDKNVDVVAATLAYAAVLVVFVGLTV